MSENNGFSYNDYTQQMERNTRVRKAVKCAGQGMFKFSCLKWVIGLTWTERVADYPYSSTSRKQIIHWNLKECRVSSKQLERIRSLSFLSSTFKNVVTNYVLINVLPKEAHLLIHWCYLFVVDVPVVRERWARFRNVYMELN